MRRAPSVCIGVLLCTLQTILSKYRDGVLGEFEFGLLADGRAYARLFCPIVFTLPPHLVVGEAFTLCFEAIGLFTVAKDDWIGLCPIGSANVNIPKNGWYRASDGGGVIAWAKTHAPPAPGWYEFRYFKGAGYSAVGAVSDPIFVKSSASAPVSEEELSRPCPPAGWVVSTRTLPVGAFTHVGITRCGRSLSIILNGELDATATVSFPAPYTDMACSLGFANRRYAPVSHLYCMSCVCFHVMFGTFHVV